MARKPALSTDNLKEHGVEKLAQLVLDEAERNPGFRRQVKAVLAGKFGPQAIAWPGRPAALRDGTGQEFHRVGQGARLCRGSAQPDRYPDLRARRRGA